MSTWGRAQDALDVLLWGMEIDQGGTWRPGLLYDKGFTYEQVSDISERILETLTHVRYHSGEPAFVDPKEPVS